MRKVFTACLVSLGVVSSAAAAVPGGSNAYGDTLEGWMLGAWEYLLGGSEADHAGNVAYLPVPNGVPTSDDPFTLTGEADVTLHPGEAWALPIFFAIGEQYEDGWYPDPSVLDDAIFTGALVDIELDGEVILSSEDDAMADYLVEGWFEDVVPYAEPYYGATGAVWIKGIGMLGQPLPPGEHALHLYVYSADIGIAFDNTWHITVAR